MAEDWLCSQPGCGLMHSEHKGGTVEGVIETQYMRFVEQPKISTQKTRRWSVLSKDKNYGIGHVRFCPQWRKYVFESSGAMFDHSCLRDIANFIETRTTEWRASL